MRWAILSDIHGNLEALQAVLAMCRSLAIDRYLCLGDIVGYGVNPEECLHLMQESQAAIIAGNHEWAVVGRMDLSWFNPVARQAVEWTREQMSVEALRDLEGLPLTWESRDVQAVHASLPYPERFSYLAGASTVQDMLDVMTGSSAFVGHTHVPRIFMQDGRDLTGRDVKHVHLSATDRCIVNVGSVGQPRDGDARAAFGIWDEEERSVQIRRVSYEVTTTQEKIWEAGLPYVLGKRLEAGR